MPPKTLGVPCGLSTHARTPPPACGPPATDACAPRCTTRQAKARISEVRELWYPWHPWYGKSVLIVGTVERRGQTACFCRLEEEADGPSLEVPCWMFDRALCGRFGLSQAAAADCADLLRLRALLQRVRAEAEDSLVQDQHRSRFEKGDADAQNSSPISVGTTRTVSDDASATNLESVSERGPAEGPAVAGSPPEDGPRSRPTPKRLGRQGGGR
jgi:hypothetical protein